MSVTEVHIFWRAYIEIIVSGITPEEPIKGGDTMPARGSRSRVRRTAT